MPLKPASALATTRMPRGFALLAGLIALIEVVLSLSDAGLVAPPDLRMRAFRLGAFWTSLLYGAPPVYPAQSVTMFFTHALLHGGFLHMALNLAVLLGLGRFTAERYGGGVVLPTFVIGAAAGGAAFGLIAMAPYPMVGASGAVFAFLGIWTVWDWHRHRMVGAPVRPVVQRVVVLAGLNVLLYIGLEGFLAWEAHLGGFLAGLALGAWFESRQAALDRAELSRRRRDAAGE
jgi:membrane associated rhomboid family serine protease